MVPEMSTLFCRDVYKRQEMHEWYENLIEMMRLEKVEKSGHIQVVKNDVNELTELHFFLLHETRDMRCLLYTSEGRRRWPTG